MKKSTKKSVKKLQKPLKKKSKPYVPKELEVLINNAVIRYLDVLGFKNYNVHIYFSKVAAPNNVEQRSAGDAAATMSVDLRYMRANLKVFPYIIDGWKNKKVSSQEIEEIIAHEVSHIATNHLFTIAVATYKEEGETHDAWEGLTTIVGRLVHEVDMRRRGFKKI